MFEQRWEYSVYNKIHTFDVFDFVLTFIKIPFEIVWLINPYFHWCFSGLGAISGYHVWKQSIHKFNQKQNYANHVHNACIKRKRLALSFYHVIS